MAHRTVKKKNSVEQTTEYPGWELHKRWAIGFAVGLLAGWLLWGG
jgi:hypothetical protein